jgi:hypothetical protein
VKKSFDIQELLHRKSKRHETKPMHPPPPLELSKETKNTLNRDLKHPSSVDLIGTKQNKQMALP